MITVGLLIKLWLILTECSILNYCLAKVMQEKPTYWSRLEIKWPKDLKATVAGRLQDRHANEMWYGMTAKLLESRGGRSFCNSAVWGNWWHRTEKGKGAFALGSLQAEASEFRQQQIHTQVVNNTHTNISQDDKFPISHTCGKQLISLILLEYRKTQHPSIRTLTGPEILICIRNTSSKCLLSGWVTTHKRVASCSASPGGHGLKYKYQRSRQCKEILSDRKVLRCIF